MLSIKKGATNQRLRIRILDSTDATPETAVAFNAAGINIGYQRLGAARVQISLVNQTSPANGWTSGGWANVGDGWYQIDVPDAAFASGSSSVLITGTVTGMYVQSFEVLLVDVDFTDSTRMGLTALPNVAFNTAGGLSSSVHISGVLPNQSGASPSLGEIYLASNTIIVDNQKQTMMYVEYGSGTTTPIGMGIVTSSTITNNKIVLNEGLPLEFSPTQGRSYNLLTLPGLVALGPARINSLRKNTAFNNFPFKMVDTTDVKVAKPGVTVTAQRAIDGGGFASCTNSPTEMANGFYRINLTASDLNGDSIVLRMTATNCTPWEQIILTQPT